MANFEPMTYKKFFVRLKNSYKIETELVYVCLLLLLFTFLIAGIEVLAGVPIATLWPEAILRMTKESSILTVLVNCPSSLRLSTSGPLLCKETETYLFKLFPPPQVSVIIACNS